jgi:hypothetical protein
MDREPPRELVDLITAAQKEVADMEERLNERFPGTEVMGCVVVRNRLAIYCSEGEPTQSDLKALLMAAKSTAAYLGGEIMIDVVEVEERPRGIGDA